MPVPLDAPAFVIARRHWLAGAAALLGLASLGSVRARAASEAIRLGTLQFGTLHWVADVIRRHDLAAAQGIALRTNILANSGAGHIALLAGADDVIVSDWMFAATQRAAGTKLCFAPFSSSLGGIIVPPRSRLSGLADLKGRRLGVAGGPTDKSWLLVQAAARAARPQTDLREDARVVYGAAPLLAAKLQQGELDGVLTFWTYAAKLQAAGCREMVSVADCARALGLPGRLNLVGFVFRQDWADAHRAACNGLLKAVAAAQRLLAGSDAEWQQVRPLMDAPDDAVFARLKQEFVAGIPIINPDQERDIAARVFDILLRTGGPQATGGLSKLPGGLFWDGPDAAG